MAAGLGAARRRREAFGQFDGVVNSAGVARPENLIATGAVFDLSGGCATC